MLGLPRNNDYRACFVAPEGFKIVDADWDQQELVIIATLANEKVWIDAMKAGKDLHSINGELIYDKRWYEAEEPNCDFKLHYKKCKCPGHKELRTKVKNLGFGLSYGLSAHGFAARNHVGKEEAEKTIEKFFTTFPSIKTFLNKCGQFGVTSSMINNNSFGGIRFFDKWKTAKKQDYYGNWVYVDPEMMREVMRASMNYPIQSFGADLLKLAMVLIRRWINNNNLREHVQLAMPYHDQILLYAKIGYEKLVAEKLEYYMKLAGKLLLKNDLLKATANISDYWIKD